MKLPARLIVTTILSILLVWGLQVYVGQYFVLTGGWAGLVTVGALLTLMNILVRPILDIVALPLKFFMTFLAIILANAAFLWVVLQITDRMDPSIVTLRIAGGLTGWIVISLILGMANWMMKELQREGW
jgi:uncharacterized membrane protein YvlD (DUF360 family)